MARITFVLGGVRSGKSVYAEKIINGYGGQKIYLATAQNIDCEIDHRIEIHKKRRGIDWQTIEEPVEITKIIGKQYINNQPVNILVDCLTLWLSNLLHYGLNLEEKTNELLEILKTSSSNIILVSNEVGQGIIPDNELARKFCDEAGILHQKVAEIADEVVLVTVGIPVKIKG